MKFILLYFLSILYASQTFSTEIESKAQFCLGDILQPEEFFEGEVRGPSPHFALGVFDEQVNVLQRSVPDE